MRLKLKEIHRLTPITCMTSIKMSCMWRGSTLFVLLVVVVSDLPPCEVLSTYISI